MTCIESTPYSRDLGDELRRLRETATRYTGKWLAELLDWDQSKLSNIENGKVRASEIDLVQYLTACGKGREFINAFLDRYRHAFDLYFVQVPHNLRTMVMAESAATTITSYDVFAVPGLLQVEDYTRELFRNGGLLAEDEVEAFVRFRMERQAILRRHDHADITFYVHENALGMVVGSAEVMEQQFIRMMFNTHVLRIVPASTVLPFGTSHVLWEFEKMAPVTFIEGDIAHLFVQDPDAVARTRSVFQRLDAVALDARQSRSVLAKLASRTRGDRNASETQLAEEQLQRPCR